MHIIGEIYQFSNLQKDEESPDIEFQYDDADSMAAEVAEVLI